MTKYLSPRQKALCEWLTANGITPDTVPMDGDLTIDTVDGQRVIRYEALVRDADGRLMLNDRGDNAAMERRIVPLLVEPPDWWEPYEKPTRAQLLATVERVRALHQPRPDGSGFPDGQQCGTCSTDGGDGYQYLVPWPCPTIRALNGEQP